MDILQRSFRSIESVQARVAGIGDNQVQLNKLQCQILASKLLKTKLFLKGNEQNLRSSRHAAHLHLLNTVTQAEHLVRKCCCDSITWPEAAFGVAEIRGDIVEVLLDLCWWQSLSHIAIATQVKSLSIEEALELLKAAEEDYVRLSKSLHANDSELQVAAESDKTELLSILVQSVKEVAAGAGKEQVNTHISATLAVHLWFRFNLAVADIEPTLNAQQEAEMELRLNEYEDPKTIGQGSFGVVLKVRYLGRPCALKVFKGIYKEEATVLRGLQHPHIVQFYRYWEAPYTSEQAHNIDRSHLLMELMSTNLTEYIAAQLKMNSSQASSSSSSTRPAQSTSKKNFTTSMPFSLPVAIDIMLQVARAMGYLHGKKMVHRDLKTDNVLVGPLSGIPELSELGYVDVKLADFGLAKVDCHSSTSHPQTPNMGTSVYGAPEVFGEDVVQLRNFPLKADVWSFSMTCSEILSGVPPYHNEMRVGLHKRIRNEGLRPALPNDCPDYLKFCIESCWQLQPARRPNFTDVCRMLKHAKWLSLDVTQTFRSMNVFFSYTTHSGYTEVASETSPRNPKKRFHMKMGKLSQAIASRLHKVIRLGGKNPLHAIGSNDSVELWHSHSYHNQFTLAEVIMATNNFRDLLGAGGFGPVYYGTLPNGQEVAVKVSDAGSRQGIQEFFNEMQLLTRVHHKNLVRLVGCCHENHHMILVYEYMSNGTLREHLHGDSKKKIRRHLDWKMRQNIALSVAVGLEYLHDGCNPSIIHRDVKSSNILLDNNWIAKVSDFGLSKENAREYTHMSTIVKGTVGYLDPEYYQTMRLGALSDVYSFGIVLLELICGRPPFIHSTNHSEPPWLITEWVRSHLQEGHIDRVVDPLLGNNYNTENMWMVANLALKCVEPRGVHRPKMSTICQELRTLLVETDICSYSGEEPLGGVKKFVQQNEDYEHDTSTSSLEDSFIGTKFAEQNEGDKHNASMTSKPLDLELDSLKENLSMVMERTLDNTVSLGQLTSQMDNMTSLFTQFIDKQKESKAHDLSSMDHVVANYTSYNYDDTLNTLKPLCTSVQSVQLQDRGFQHPETHEDSSGVGESSQPSEGQISRMMEAYGVQGLNEMNISMPASKLESMARPPSFDDTFEHVCIKMRGLPSNVKQKDILEFFAGYNILSNNMHILMGATNRPTGEAFVEFVSSNETHRAMARHGQIIDSHYIELFRVTKSNMLRATRRV